MCVWGPGQAALLGQDQEKLSPGIAESEAQESRKMVYDLRESF